VNISLDDATVQIGVPGGRQLIIVTPFDAAPAEDR
jgi:hypothetical protein